MKVGQANWCECTNCRWPCRRAYLCADEPAIGEFKAHGIHLASLEERTDTSSAAGELVFHLLGVIAHIERRLISERTCLNSQG